METKNKKARIKCRSLTSIKTTPTEAQVGRAFYKWWGMAYKGLGVPHPGLLFHIPNEGAGGNPIRGAILKGQGVVAGIPDYFLAIPSCGYHGLFVELKRETGKLSAQQVEIIAQLSRQNYATCICFSLNSAIDEVVKYIRKNNEKIKSR